MPLVLTETEKAYLAGIVDGEGTITIFTNGSVFSLRVGVSGTSIVFASWVSEKFGKNVVTDKHKKYKHKNYKDCYSVSLHGDEAKELLSLIIPYLITKREQAAIALQFPTKFSKGNSYTEEDKLLRAICAIKLSDLNCRKGKTEESAR